MTRAEQLISEYLEAIQDPISPVSWQRKPDKTPKRKKVPQSTGGSAPPGNTQYADQGDMYQGVA